MIANLTLKSQKSALLVVALLVVEVDLLVVLEEGVLLDVVVEPVVVDVEDAAVDEDEVVGVDIDVEVDVDADVVVGDVDVL